MISCLFVCLLILRDINYYYSCSIYAATLYMYVECGPIFRMPACAFGLRVPCKALINRTTAKFRPRNFGSRAWFKIDWQNVV